ncbi:MAG: hypothetical protein ACR2RV_26345, partial [Verrucomicrobiales bacterium]
ALDYQVGPNGEIDIWSIGTIAGRDILSVSLGAERNWAERGGKRENLYRIEVGSQFFYLPMSAEQPGVVGAEPGGENAAATGLWVGTVVFSGVTQLGESTATATTSTAPMRILIHVDAGGQASLVSEVTLMQEKNAAPETEPSRVLVVDDSKLSNFEGIEERDGKLIGLRLSTVGYDMPRDMDPGVQTEVVDEVAAADNIDPTDVTLEQILTWVDGQSERPVSLAENYVLSWPLTGGLGSGETLTTTSDLVLDPFHRSNPYRHAFHPRHGTGFAISRSLTIAIDTTTETDFFTGTYQETISGLADRKITAQGMLSLRRISMVGLLQ